MRQRMMDNIREKLEIKGDDEWKAILGLVEKVNTARREVPGGMGGRMGFGGPGGRRGGQAGQPADANAQPQRPRNNPFGAEPLAEQEELQKAFDGKASKDELKAKLAKFREVVKEKEAKLAKAQADLRAVLTVRQEAAAVLLGLLK